MCGNTVEQRSKSALCGRLFGRPLDDVDLQAVIFFLIKRCNLERAVAGPACLYHNSWCNHLILPLMKLLLLIKVSGGLDLLQCKFFWDFFFFWWVWWLWFLSIKACFSKLRSFNNVL